MKKLLIVMAGFLLATSWAYPQTSKNHTSPKMPARDALQRMGLVTAWSARVKVEGQRDGLYSVQIIPALPNPQLVAQTYAGAVYLFDAENGDLIWKTKVGIPFWSPQPVGYNSHSIFATRRSILHVINRFDGKQRAYTVDPQTRVATFGYDLSYTPSAGPVADEEILYVSMGNRVQAFEIPDYDYMDKARLAQEKRAREEAAKGDKGKKDDKAPPYAEDGERAGDRSPPGLDSAQPEYYWGYLMAGETTEHSPLVAGDQLCISTSLGNLISLPRFGRRPREERFEFKATGRVPAAAAQHGAMAYLASDDYNLYAVNMRSGDLIWRHVSGAPILRKPEVNDRDIFIAPERTGLRRVDRLTGKEVWTNRDAVRFVAATTNYVYALNHVGKFHVLDARRGTTLASYDLMDWALHVPNDLTDRIYLAANDGQILCLRPRDSVKALIMKTLEDKKPEEKKIRPEKKKDEEKKKDDDKKKDEEKKKDDDKEKAGIEFEPGFLPPNWSAPSPILARASGSDRRFWAGP